MATATPVLPISVIIPTYCEEKLLPKVLESITQQIYRPLEIIIADNHSPDKTREIARSYGAQVVDGGSVAQGRNAGARVAQGEYLLFLDADSKLPSRSMLGEAFFSFIQRKVDIASAKYVPDSDGSTRFGYGFAHLVFGVWNGVRAIQKFFSVIGSEGGAFILIKKRVFDAIGGFDEQLQLSEDSEFFKRVTKAGYKYWHLDQEILTSTRRYDTPRNAIKGVIAPLTQAFLVGLGIYAGSRIIKRLQDMYGPLGGKPKKPEKVG